MPSLSKKDRVPCACSELKFWDLLDGGKGKSTGKNASPTKNKTPRISRGAAAYERYYTTRGYAPDWGLRAEAIWLNGRDGPPEAGRYERGEAEDAVKQ